MLYAYATTGSMFASVAWAELLGALIGNIMYINIYRATLTTPLLSGLAFLTMGLVYIIAAIMTG